MENSKDREPKITFFGMNFPAFCCCGDRKADSVASFDSGNYSRDNVIEKKKRGMAVEDKQPLISGDQLQYDSQSKVSNQESWIDIDEFPIPPDASLDLNLGYPPGTVEDPNSNPEEYYTKDPIDFDIFISTNNKEDKEESARSELTISSHSKKIIKDKPTNRKRNTNLKKDVQKAQQGATGVKKRNKRQPWLPHEDARLLELIAKHGQSWALIASQMEGRTGKQIRDRFLNKLRPGVKSGDWTSAEDQLLLSLYYQIGSKWSKIATHMPGRTEGQVKNRFYSHIKKKLLKLDGSETAGSPDTLNPSPTNRLNIDTSNLGSPTNGQLRQVTSPNNQFQIQPQMSMQSEINLNQPTFGQGNPNDYSPSSQNIFNRPPVQLADPTDLISYNNEQSSQYSNYGQKGSSSMYPENPTSPDSYFAIFSTNHSLKSEKDITEAIDNVGQFFEKDNNIYLPQKIDEDYSPSSDNMSTKEKLERYELLTKRKRNLELLLQKTLYEIERINPSFEQLTTNGYIH